MTPAVPTAGPFGRVSITDPVKADRSSVENCDRFCVSAPSTSCVKLDGFSSTVRNSANGSAQGNRISKQGQELGEICVIPSGAFEFAAQGSFGGILLHHVQRHVSQHREVVWPVVQSAPVLILVHYDIEPPV